MTSLLTEQQIKRIIRAVLKETPWGSSQYDLSNPHQKVGATMEIDTGMGSNPHKLSSPHTDKDINFLKSLISDMRNLLSMKPGSYNVDEDQSDANWALSGLVMYARDVITNEEEVFLEDLFDQYDIEDFSVEEVEHAKEIISTIAERLGLE